MLFPTDEEALQYLQEQVPSNNAQSPEVRWEALDEELFPIPDDWENMAPGTYEFLGKNGLSVSFELVNASYLENRCRQQIGGYFEEDDGQWLPVYQIRNLVIKSPKFTYDQNEGRGVKIKSLVWLPRIGADDKGSDYVNIGTKEIYLVGKGGLLSRVKDLLAFFHEVGHIESRPNGVLSPDAVSYSDLFGERPMTPKRAAYQLQAEKDADDWMIAATTELFDDLDVPEEIVQGYIEGYQLDSYYRASRTRMEIFLAKIEEEQRKKDIVSIEKLWEALRTSGEAFNQLRKDYPEWTPQLPDEPMEGLNLDGIDLSGMELKGKIFKECSLVGADFRQASLKDCEFKKCDIRNSKFNNAELSNLRIEEDSNLDEASFVNARTRGNELHIIDTSLNGADLTGAELLYGEFTRVKMKGAKLDNVVLPLAFSYVTLDEARGTNVSFNELDNCSLVDIVFQRANLHSSKITNSNLTGADLSGATLCNAKFNGSDLTNAKLSDSDLRHADFTGATLTGINIEGAKTEEAVGLT